MSYAVVDDVLERMTRSLSVDEERTCETLLEDAALMIDAINPDASEKVKKTVSCRMVVRALGPGEDVGIPVGATQGSMSALGYSQSWTIGNGSTGELYLSKIEKKLLGAGNKIGFYSPVQEFAIKEN